MFEISCIEIISFYAEEKNQLQEKDLKFISKLKYKVIGEIKEDIFENKNQQITYSDLYDIFLRYNDEPVNKFFIFNFYFSFFNRNFNLFIYNYFLVPFFQLFQKDNV